MKKRFVIFVAVLLLLALPVAAAEDYLHWVEFKVGYPVLSEALALDISSHETDQPLSWIDILAFAATRCGDSQVSVRAVRSAAKELSGKDAPEKLLGKQYKYFAYYREAFHAVLGGLVGSYAIEVPAPDGGTEWAASYGLKAFSPIAAGYGYGHYPDFGQRRSYGFSRPHLGNDLMGALGTPVVAVEGGVIEAMGWNRYGGWRIGIRSFDSRRYYYYAHLQKDTPFAPGLAEGDTVQAGDVIGFMGRTGYSDRENVNNIETVHLHFGLELVFDESQKECNSEIWINVYDIVRLLSGHRSSIQRTENGWGRVYPYQDLDWEEYPKTLP